jgi:hypothetical protein
MIESEPSSDGTIIEVQHWSVSNSFTPKHHLLISGNGQDELHLVSLRLSVNYAKLTFHSLDTIGLAGFSHDFGALSGKASNIATVFDSIGSLSFMDVLLFMLSSILPVPKVPTARQLMLDKLNKTITGLSDKFLATTGDVTKDKSVIGLLGK